MSMKLRVTDKRMGERRRHPGRREEDPSKVSELSWQEACGHDRKVIKLLQEGYERFTRITIAALAVLLVITCVSVYFAWRANRRSDHLATQATTLVKDNSERVRDIQKARFEAAYNQCTDTNSRNMNTIRRLNGAVDNFERKKLIAPKQAAETKATNDFIIQALVPFTKDCVAEARTVVKGTTGQGH